MDGGAQLPPYPGQVPPLAPPPTPPPSLPILSCRTFRVVFVGPPSFQSSVSIRPPLGFLFCLLGSSSFSPASPLLSPLPSWPSFFYIVSNPNPFMWGPRGGRRRGARVQPEGIKWRSQLQLSLHLQGITSHHTTSSTHLLLLTPPPQPPHKPNHIHKPYTLGIKYHT